MIFRCCVLAMLLGASLAAQQNLDPQVTSFLGRKLYALADEDGAVQKAKDALAQDPKNVALALKLSKAQAGKRQYREAVATCTTALVLAPNNADLYVERGHRELGLREFRAALADLSRSVALDPRQLDAYYHLGLAQYFLGRFGEAAESFGRALKLATSADSVIDCSNWQYVSLRRSGQKEEADKGLARITPEVKNTEPHLFFYLQLLHFYQGRAGQEAILPAKPSSASDIEGELSYNTINYGLGNWHLYNGDRAGAMKFFRNAVSGFAWNSWGFIGSELELANDPAAPQPILQGGIVLPLYESGSSFVKGDRFSEPEHYNMSQSVPGRINSVVNIHNPSIEVHTVDRSLNTGAAVILVAGGGHNTLNVGSEAADFVPFFYNYGVNTIILRNRLRRDGYNPQTDAVNDALQAIRMVRAHAKEWNLDEKRIGMMGFSAGAELTAAAAVLYNEFDGRNKQAGDAYAGISSRPDFVGIIYPGPSPFARDRTAPVIPRYAPPSFVICAGQGDHVHTVWALEYYSAMLNAGIPNIEMHLYGNGRHPGDQLTDGSRMSGGLTDRHNTPFGTWQLRFIDWFRDLGFLQEHGMKTKAAKDSEEFSAAPANVSRE